MLKHILASMIYFLNIKTEHACSKVSKVGSSCITMFLLVKKNQLYVNIRSRKDVLSGTISERI